MHPGNFCKYHNAVVYSSISKDNYGLIFAGLTFPVVSKLRTFTTWAWIRTSPERNASLGPVPCASGGAFGIQADIRFITGPHVHQRLPRFTLCRPVLRLRVVHPQRAPCQIPRSRALGRQHVGANQHSRAVFFSTTMWHGALLYGKHDRCQELSRSAHFGPLTTWGRRKSGIEAGFFSAENA